MILLLLSAVFVFLFLAYRGYSYWATLSSASLIFTAWLVAGVESTPLFSVFGGVAVLGAILFSPLCRRLVSKPLMYFMGRNLPSIGETEEIALGAGTVWWDGELFSGTPDWHKLLDFTINKLSAEEQEYLDGPVEELCRRLDDWQVNQGRDLPQNTWEFIKANKFFGMIIPRQYGGMGFSAAAHSAVITKISSRSVAGAVTVMVPNSLGPAELLLNYGTEEQKEYYLPRLARAEEVPCFALTESGAGSDAASAQSRGVVCQGEWQGAETTGIRLAFKKRYITLAPVATVIGLAFHLYDPDHLLGADEDVGITCALVPSDTPGVRIGRRHDPMGVPFANGPIDGEDVFIPLELIIGGKSYAGKGWRMLMETLSAGRGISLPSLSVGAVELAARVTSAYTVVREQFGLAIGRFEGVREPLVRIAGHAYFMNAVRRLTYGAVDAGERPAVLSAVAKAYLTEGMRSSLNDAMDIMAGAAICRGPANPLSSLYSAVPIGITVEGANILTRSLIVFGQGAIRCHPFLQDEITALKSNDLSDFDRAFWGHLNHVLRNGVRSFAQALVGRLLIRAPVQGKEAGYYRQLSRMAMAFSFIADLGLITLGAAVKRKEYLSGRYADALAWLYLASAALKRFHDEDDESTRPLLDWSLQKSLYEIEKALLGILDNLPNRLVATVGRTLAFPLGARFKRPSDRQIEAVANSLLEQGESQVRERITEDIFTAQPGSPGLGVLEEALARVVAAQTARVKLDLARRGGLVVKEGVTVMAKNAREKGILSGQEFEQLLAAEQAREAAVKVSDFDWQTYFELR